jgi:hypothetical protein
VARLEIDLPLVGGLGFDDVGDNRSFSLAIVDPRLVVVLIMSDRSTARQNRACWRMLLAPIITMPSFVS